MKKYALYMSAFLGAANVAYGEGFVYVQTNEVENQIIVYQKNDDGSLKEMKRVATSGSGTGEKRPLYDGKPGPDPLVSHNSLIFAEDSSLLFASNAGDNSVSVFKVGDDGMPELIDREASEGNVVNSLTYRPTSQTLYVGHLFGPEHIKVMDFADNDLKLRDDSHTLDTDDHKGRIQSQVLVSPTGDYLLGNVLFEQNPDGSGLLPSTDHHIAVFPVSDDGALETPKFHTLMGSGPFASAFLDAGDNHFVTMFAVSNNLTLHKLEDGGGMPLISNAKGDDTATDGAPLDYCWISLSPDQDYAYVTATSTGSVSSFKISSSEVSFAKVGQAKTTKEGEPEPTSSHDANNPTPLDSWGSDDGYFYQVYGSTGKLGAFRMTEDGGLEEIAFYDVPMNSVQGITGY